MRRKALYLLVLFASVAIGQPQTGGFGIGGASGRGGPSFASYAFFEFAPTNGAGMGAACACSAVTGAKGEAVTFTRTGSAICSRRGLATTGIANGDLVSCGGNLPRVEPSGGVLGLRVEGSRTNDLLRSEELDNAAWTLVAAGGASAPTVTANFAVAPDGTASAERVQIPAVGLGQASAMRQIVASSGGVARVCSFFVRGNGTSGALYVYNSLASGGSTPTTCNYVSSSWARCDFPHTSGLNDGCDIGNNTFLAGPSSMGSHDVLIWGADRESTGTYATSYIPTVAASVTRNDELAQASIVGPGLQVGSLSVRTDTIRASGGYPTPLALSTLSAVPASGANQRVIYSNGTSGSTFQCYAGNSTPTLFSTGAAAFTPPQTGVHSYWCASTGVGGTLSGAVDGNSFAASGSMSGSFGAESFVTIGSSNNVITYVDTIVSLVCRDPDPTRCR